MLTPEERTKAEGNGWLLCDVYDTETKRWIVQVLPAPNHVVQSVQTLFTVLLARAASGDDLARRLVNLVMGSIAPKAKPKKAKK